MSHPSLSALAVAVSILRRYEFYRFSGAHYPETREARFSGADAAGRKYGDSSPGPGDLGNYLGAQNGAVNLAHPGIALRPGRCAAAP